VADLPKVAEKTEVILGGMITNIKERNVQKSRSGLTRMAKLTFEDLSGATPAMLWPEEFAKMAEFVKDDRIVFVKGTLDHRRDPAELVISRIIPFEQGPSELARGVIVRLHKGIHQSEHLERLLRLVRVRPGNLDLYLEIVGLDTVRRAIYRAGPSLSIRYEEALIANLEAVVGPGNVRLRGLRGATARVDGGSTPAVPPRTAPAPPQVALASESDTELDESLLELADEV
jgi:DNA polymerase-3 subunit alpha